MLSWKRVAQEKGEKKDITHIYIGAHELIELVLELSWNIGNICDPEHMHAWIDLNCDTLALYLAQLHCILEEPSQYL